MSSLESIYIEYIFEILEFFSNNENVYSDMQVDKLVHDILYLKNILCNDKEVLYKIYSYTKVISSSIVKKAIKDSVYEMDYEDILMLNFKENDVKSVDSNYSNNALFKRYYVLASFAIFLNEKYYDFFDRIDFTIFCWNNIEAIKFDAEWQDERWITIYEKRGILSKREASLIRRAVFDKEDKLVVYSELCNKNDLLSLIFSFECDFLSRK